MSEWISVDDRLPELYIDVLAFSVYGEFDGAPLKRIEKGSYGGMFWTDSHGYDIETVTHWMPLPLPPEAQ